LGDHRDQAEEWPSDAWPSVSETDADSGPVALPDAPALARLVSNVTGPMCGKTFAPASEHARGQSICGRMFLLPLQGKRDINIILSSDAAGSEALGAAMFGRPPQQLTRQMVDDAIRELLNMVAGQVQKHLKIDQPLGLPRPISLAELTAAVGVGFSDALLLTSSGIGDMKLWIFERTHDEKTVTAPGGGFVRSLFRKLTSH
jgi:hypothetical protein